MALPSPDSAASDSLNLDSDLWRFAHAFYGGKGVSPACLALQEALGIDVNFVLFGAVYVLAAVCWLVFDSTKPLVHED